MSNTGNKTNSNLIWVICIMAFIILALISYLLLDRVLCADRIMTYLAFLSTILSILLSIFAILFSYYSSGSIDRKMGEIDVAVSTIKETNSSLHDSNSQLLELMFHIQERVVRIDTMQGKTRNNLLDNTELNSTDLGDNSDNKESHASSLQS